MVAGFLQTGYADRVRMDGTWARSRWGPSQGGDVAALRPVGGEVLPGSAWAYGLEKNDVGEGCPLLLWIPGGTAWQMDSPRS